MSTFNIKVNKLSRIEVITSEKDISMKLYFKTNKHNSNELYYRIDDNFIFITSTLLQNTCKLFKEM